MNKIIYGIGTDIVAISRITKILNEKYCSRFL